MGAFAVTLEIGDPQGSRFETVEALVDTGATLASARPHSYDALGWKRPDAELVNTRTGDESNWR